MNILHITCSPRGKSAESYLLSQRILARLLEKNPQANIISRDLWADQLPHVDSDYAASLGGTAILRRRIENRLAGHVRTADC